MPPLPEPRGPVSAFLLGEVVQEPHPLPPTAVAEPADPLTDEDIQLALYVLYELHYRCFDGVDARWEWEPSLLALRATLERRWSSRCATRRRVPTSTNPPRWTARGTVADSDSGPSLSRYLAERGTGSRSASS